MDERSQLTNLILVLCQQQYIINKRTPRFTDLANEVVSLIKKPTDNGSSSDSSIVVKSLLDVVNKMLNDGLSREISVTGVVSYLRTVCSNFPKIVDQIEKNLDGIETRTDAELEGNISYLSGNLETWISATKYKRILSKANFEFDPDESREEHLAKLQEDLSRYAKDATELRSLEDLPAIVESVNLNDLVSFKEKFVEPSEEEEESAGVFKLDIDGWNQSFGDGGIKIPTVTLLNALTGRGKTDTALRIVRSICKCNDAETFLRDKTKKPLIFIISMENTMNDIITNMYHDFLGEEEGLARPQVDSEVAHEYLRNTLLKRGWHLQVIFAKKKTLDCSQIEMALRFLEREGYELKLCILDYLQLLDYGSPAKSGKLDTQLIKDCAGELEGMIKGDRKASLITMAQLNPRLKEFISTCPDFAKKYGPQMETAFCRGLGDEFDYAGTVHVQFGDDGNAYHQFNMDKNRKCKTVTLEQSYSCYSMCKLEDGTQGGFIKGDIDWSGIVDSRVRNTMGGCFRKDGGGDSYDDF